MLIALSGEVANEPLQIDWRFTIHISRCLMLGTFRQGGDFFCFV